jgi:hypothetical protein
LFILQSVAARISISYIHRPILKLLHRRQYARRLNILVCLVLFFAKIVSLFLGQKCSAAGRAYVPESMWPKLKTRLLDIHKQLKVGSVSCLILLIYIILLQFII